MKQAIQVQTKTKDRGFTYRTNADCISKLQSLKNKYNNLNPPSLNKSTKKLESKKKKQATGPFKDPITLYTIYPIWDVSYIRYLRVRNTSVTSVSLRRR